MTASTFPAWISDASTIPDPLGHGDRAVTFLRRLRHPNADSANHAPGPNVITHPRAFQLHPWQERIVRRIYGPRHPDGSRIVKTVFLMLPRGNRKTSLAAALSLLHLFGPETRPSSQVIFAACDREQASIGFREAANIIREDKRLLNAVKRAAIILIFRPAALLLGQEPLERQHLQGPGDSRRCGGSVSQAPEGVPLANPKRFRPDGLS
ncbi:MAG: terminase large subunit domain-containing protein [Paracoccus hibiscisoli]|uniref:terminase large subunit domain-containing protein n=1 Tax=Paracoccus hibiscisoli TaxID=2023261 RepID=UPI00391CF51D